MSTFGDLESECESQAKKCKNVGAQSMQAAYVVRLPLHQALHDNKRNTMRAVAGQRITLNIKTKK